MLTHAHIDHSGKIPKLYLEGYRNPVIATKATCDLCNIMLPDSGHIQEIENEWKNKKRIRKGQKPRPPLYTAEDAIKSLELFKSTKYDELIQIDQNITVRFNDAGHMLGSSIIEIWVKEEEKQEKLVFTGDLGNNDIPLLGAPTMINNTDYLIMESTYGNRLHMNNENKAELFLNIVYETLKKGGNVIIPSFAVGRTQEIIYELNKIKEEKNNKEFIEKYEEIMKAPVYVDSPLAISATEIFKQNTDLFDEEVKKRIENGDHPLEFTNLHFTKTAEESKALNENTFSSIIISASGMCDAGRIKHHLKHNLWNPKNTILFVGFQAEGTLGARIVAGEKKVKIFGEEFTINARIEYVEGFSGHADQEGLLNFIYSFIRKPKHIFLVHGEEKAQEALAEAIKKELNIPITIPEQGETYKLNNEIYVTAKKENKEKEEYLRLEVLERLDKLKEELKDVERIIKDEISTENETKKDNEIIDISYKIKELKERIAKIIS